ncbi:MAG: glycosyltransferase [Chloroflexi bacterium]|nr:glycosyltransferase [Chloroflexota bacterium]
MRIGMLADTYKPHISGVTNYISLNKKRLEALGHQVYVFTFGDPETVDDEPNIIRAPGVPLIQTGYYFSFGYPRAVSRKLQSMDIIHIHHPFLSGRLALHYCKHRNIPLVFTNHTRYDLYIQAYLPVLPEGMGETFLKAYLPAFCRSVDLVISPSDGMKAVLRNLGVDAPIEVIPNGVDLASLQRDLHPIPREELGFSREDIVLINVGRLAPEKNLPFLIRSFTKIFATHPQTKLLLIGDGPDRRELEGLVSDFGLQKSICFTGSLPYSQIPRYLAAADAFVTASVTEVHPLSIIEAMALGLPVLGIDSPGVGDTIQDGFNGLLSKSDMGEFSGKMTHLVEDARLRLRLGAGARQSAESYAIEKTSQMVASQYQILVERKMKAANLGQQR